MRIVISLLLVVSSLYFSTTSISAEVGKSCTNTAPCQSGENRICQGTLQYNDYFKTEICVIDISTCSECSNKNPDPFSPPLPDQTSDSTDSVPLTTSSLSTDLSGTNQQSSHEKAVERLNKGLLPDQINLAITPKPQSEFDKIISVPASILPSQVIDYIKIEINKLMSQIFGYTPFQKEMFASRSDTQYPSMLPEEVKQKDDNVIKQTSLELGGNVGIYSKDSPSQILDNLSTSNTNKTINYEWNYEQSNFPEGVNPITLSTPTPTSFNH